MIGSMQLLSGSSVYRLVFLEHSSLWIQKHPVMAHHFSVQLTKKTGFKAPAYVSAAAQSALKTQLNREPERLGR
jgi:hypothetical protein